MRELQMHLQVMASVVFTSRPQLLRPYVNGKHEQLVWLSVSQGRSCVKGTDLLVIHAYLLSGYERTA